MSDFMVTNWDEIKDTGFSPLDKGDYGCEIEEAMLKPTKKGDGKRLELKLVVITGHGEGRSLFHNINVENPNPVAQNIGLSQFKELGTACGFARPPNFADEFVGKKVTISVDQKLNTFNNMMQNDVKKIKAFSNVTPAAANQGVAQRGNMTRPAAKAEDSIPF
jgi:hypothetical protein